MTKSAQAYPSTLHELLWVEMVACTDKLRNFGSWMSGGDEPTQSCFEKDTIGREPTYEAVRPGGWFRGSVLRCICGHSGKWSLRQ